jgi:hypothetical protein
VIKMSSKKTAPSIDKWLKEAKSDPEALKEGMYLVHNGTVRQTSRAKARQGVEDDDMNLICLGGRVTAFAAALEFITAFLNAKFIGAERHLRRLEKVKALEKR